MKNHIKVGGKLLQTNKKWHHLKRSQQEWIKQICNEHSLDEVWQMIQEREINIPYHEVKKHSK